MRNDNNITNIDDTNNPPNELLGRILEELLNQSIEILVIEREGNKENEKPVHPNIIQEKKR